MQVYVLFLESNGNASSAIHQYFASLCLTINDESLLKLTGKRIQEIHQAKTDWETNTGNTSS